MNERNKGRFGVKTNQTLKFSHQLNVEREKGCIFEWQDVSGLYGRQHVVSHSLDKHRRWELVPEDGDQETSSSSQFEEKQERKEKNKDDKREDFQRKTDKSKHTKRLERKEQNKQAAILEKQKESQAQTQPPEYQQDDEKVVKIYTSGSQIRGNLTADKAPDLNIYVPENEGVRMKKGQNRHREKYIYGGDVEPRREKKEQFVKSIFL